MSETRNLRLMRALEGAAIRTIESETLTDRLTTIVGQTYLLLGYQTPDSRTLAILVAKIASDLVESYGFMTVEEVSYCFDLGAKGLLGDFAGMNMRTVTRWLKGYKHSDIRYQAIMALRAERARAISSEAFSGNIRRAIPSTGSSPHGSTDRCRSAASSTIRGPRSSTPSACSRTTARRAASICPRRPARRSLTARRWPGS